MNSQQVIDCINQLLYVTIEIGLPILGSVLLLGLLISIFQAATQINEATLSFLPKIAAIIVILMILSPWFLRKMTDYTKETYAKIPEISRMRK